MIYDVLIDIENKLERHASCNEPVVKLFNDGIGAYEYWGARGVDHGTNYAELDTEPLKIYADVSTLFPDEIEELIDILKTDNYGTYKQFFEPKKGNPVYVRARFEVIKTEVRRDILLLGATLIIVADWVN